MHRLTFVLVAALVSIAGAAQAQDLGGQWQGAVQAGPQNLRMVIKISKIASGYEAVLYSIDQSPQGIAGTVTAQGTAVKIVFPGLGATFEGKLSADGNSIAGALSRGPMPVTLNLVRASGDIAWKIPEVPAALRPMAATATPKVETATIKPSRPDQQGKVLTIRGRTLVTINTSVSDLIVFGYGLHQKQVIGAPAWIESEKFDLTVQPDGEGVPNERQIRMLLQQILSDRFGLATHRDKRELPAYVLTVAKEGMKLTKSSGDPNGLPGLMFRGLGVLPVTNATMDNFAGVMQAAVLDRPVVDQTGLTGRYDFTLTWTPDESQFASMGVRVPPPTGDPNAPPGLFTAIQEQLGLKLESTKAPVDVLVVDRIQRPSEN
jgi:uncharacterized protein (TIGR03435 family)